MIVGSTPTPATSFLLYNAILLLYNDNIKGTVMGNSGSFKKGMVPWNKGKRGYMGVNRTSFTKETVNRSPAGTPFATKDGYICGSNIFVLKKDPRSPKFYMCRKRIPYSHWVLERAGIKVPVGYVVYHIDGNKFNDDIRNLEVISRAELANRNRRPRGKK